MKTKALLLTAILTVAGTAGLMAQSSNVYSQNIVGYVSQTIPAGFSILACQLKNTPDNKITTLIPNPPEETIIYKWDNAQSKYLIKDFNFGSWSGDANLTLNPGEGMWIKCTTAFTNTFVGEVQLASTNVIFNGLNIISSVIPQSASLTSLGYVPAEGDQTYQWNNAQSKYILNDYNFGSWAGANGAAGPQLAVGESLWIKNISGTSNTWVRTFNVGP